MAKSGLLTDSPSMEQESSLNPRSSTEAAMATSGAEPGVVNTPKDTETQMPKSPQDESEADSGLPTDSPSMEQASSLNQRSNTEAAIDTPGFDLGVKKAPRSEETQMPKSPQDESEADSGLLTDIPSMEQASSLNPRSNTEAAIDTQGVDPGVKKAPKSEERQMPKNPQDKSKPDIDETTRILIVGKTGAGKSSSGNTILGREEFASKTSAVEVTKECQKGRCEYNDRHITVVDTAWFNTNIFPLAIKECIDPAIDMSSPGPHVIIFVIRLRPFTGEEAWAVKIVQGLLGKDAARYMMVLFTGQDDLKHQNESLETYLADSGEQLKDLIKSCGNQYCAVNNRASGEELENQRKQLLVKIEDIKEGNEGSFYTSDMYKEVEKTLNIEQLGAANHEEKVLRILLVGSTGVGKSATGNSILGKRRFVSRASPTSVTMKWDQGVCVRNGKLLLVVDTPGLFDKKTLQEDIKQCREFWSRGSHAIVLVLQSGRYSQEEQESLERIQSVLGVEDLQHMVVVFTRKEDLEDQSIKDFVSESEPKLRNLLAKCGGHYCAFNNKANKEENDQQVEELIKLVEMELQQNVTLCNELGTQCILI